MSFSHYIYLDDARWRELGALARKYHCDRHLAASASITALWAAEFPQNDKRRHPEHRRRIRRPTSPSSVQSVLSSILPTQDEAER
jgi:hypothetical protein